MKGACDVCRRERDLRVCGSGLGPISWAYCFECAQKPAEPDCMIAATIDGCGGLENVAAWARQIWTWRKGGYVSFDEAAIAIEAAIAGETVEHGSTRSAKARVRKDIARKDIP